MNFTAKLVNTQISEKKSSGILFGLLTFIYFVIIFLAITGINNNAFSQDMRLENIESGTEYNGNNNSESLYPSALDDQMKSAMESKNESEVKRLQSEIESHMNNENISSAKHDSEVRFEKYENSGSEGDWMSTDNIVHTGQIKSLPSYNKQIDIKCGEDSILYSAVNEKEVSGLYSGKVSFYKSSDNGNSWSGIGAIFTPVSVYITNISLLVESRSLSIKDSTRIILFYTKASSNNNDLSVLSFITFRVNGSSVQAGEIATSAANTEISHISAVSDGAYYSNGTYFGVVCTISNLSYTNVQSFKVIRTFNWGSSWTTSSFSTGFNDFYPSVDFYKGTPAQIYIAVERRPASGPKKLVLLRTNWSPTSAFTEQEISDANIEKPCLTIQKTSTPDSMIITAVNNGQAVYYGSRTSGEIWYGYNLSMNLANNFKFTHCFSSPIGSPAFTTLVSTKDGDSINVRRGGMGALGEIFYKVNSHNADTNISPVSAFCIGHETNLTSFIYGGSNSENLYFDQYGFRWLLIGAAIQGLYNPGTNKHNIDDTVTVLFRNSAAPYEIVDSIRAVLDSSLLIFDYYTKKINKDYGYYLVLKHRNSIETWSKSPVFLNSSSFYNYGFTVSANSAYGNNLIQVDNSPVMYSIYSGDVNQDGAIDALDIGLTDNDAFNFASGYVKTDVTGNNIVDVNDLAIIDNNAFNFVSKITPP